MPVSVAPIPQFQAFDQNGNPLAFGCVFTYASGTSTQQATYSDNTGTIANPNPVPLSASGSANIWIQAGKLYTFTVVANGGTNCSLGTLMYSVNGIGGGSAQTVTPVTFSATPAFTVIAQNQLFTITLTGNAVSLPVSFVNVQAPALITFQITQDGTGSRTFAWPSNVTGGVTIDSAANHTTSQTFVWNGTTILPVGNGFNSAGNTLFGGNIISANTYTAANSYSSMQTFNGGITDSTMANSSAVCTNGSGRLITTGCSAGIVHTVCADGAFHQVLANTTAQQIITTCKIPAGTINAVGSTFRLTTGINVTPGGTAASGGQTAFGGTSALGTNFSGVVTQGSSNDNYAANFIDVCVVSATGVSGTASCTEISAASGLASPFANIKQESITLNTAADFYVGTACSFFTGSTSNTCSTAGLTVEQLN